MVNLSLNELELKTKIRVIKDYKSMPINKLLSILDASESVKTIREIRKENHANGKILRDLGFIFDPEKDHNEPKNTVSAFNDNYIQYESMGDRDKNISTKEYIDVIRPYLGDMINNHKTQGRWKIHSGNTITEHKIQGERNIHLIMAINFISSKDFKDSKNSDKTLFLHFRSDNIEIMMGSETDEISEDLYESFLRRYQELLEESMEGSHFTFNSVEALFHKVDHI